MEVTRMFCDNSIYNFNSKDFKYNNIERVNFMFNLKPHEDYPEFFSESKIIYKNKKGYWTLKEHYGESHYLSIDYWKYTFEHKNVVNHAFWKKKIHIPLNLYAFYIQFIYKHTGKCHKDLRSKYYIGKSK